MAGKDKKVICDLRGKHHWKFTGEGLFGVFKDVHCSVCAVEGDISTFMMGVWK